MSKDIYILHERETRSHFIALEVYAKKANRLIKYREFSITRALLRGVLYLSIKVFIKQIINIASLCTFLFTKNKTIILGIAPFDWRLYFLKWILKKHDVFYFTSWVDWSGEFFPKKKFSDNPQLKNAWKVFLENEVSGIFSVSKTGLKSLQKHYDIHGSCSVVNHSFNDKIKKNYDKQVKNKKLKLIYVGRLIKSKGIEELLDLVVNLNPQLYELTIIGDGELKSLVSTFSMQYSNIRYEGFIDSQNQLFNLYRQHDVQILFSRKTELWEELFGMVIIEAMANGVVTISTNHAGPSEIIENKVNGFVIPDDENIVATTKNILVNGLDDLQTMKKNAIIESKKYESKEVATKWKCLLDE